MDKAHMTEKGLHMLLTSKYGCKSLGKPLAPPYVLEDDMPTYYLSPANVQFSVPPPPDGATYSPIIVEKIIQAGGLEVVVDIAQKQAQIKKREP